MVWLNTIHQNFPASPGSFGGSRCTCIDCNKNRQEELPHSHCWHDTDKTLTSDPLQSEEVCCYCDLLRKEEF